MKYYNCLRCLLLFVLLLCCCYGHAQFKDNIEYNIWQAKAGDTFAVFGKVANVRTEPATTAAVQDSLPCGTRVIIRQISNTQQYQKGIYAPWAKVSYQVAGKVKEGYIWEGLLALGTMQTGGTQLVYGIEKITQAQTLAEDNYEPSIWMIRVKALNGQGVLLDEKEVKLSASETSVSSGKLLGDMGLRNVRDIIRINFGGEACGIANNYYYFAWTGAKFLSLPGKMEVGDAGVYYHGETFLFPKEPGGQPGKIIKLTEEGEADEEKVDKEGNPIFKIKKAREVYTWDGIKALRVR